MSTSAQNAHIQRGFSRKQFREKSRVLLSFFIDRNVIIAKYDMLKAVFIFQGFII